MVSEKSVSFITPHSEQSPVNSGAESKDLRRGYSGGLLAFLKLFFLLLSLIFLRWGEGFSSSERFSKYSPGAVLFFKAKDTLGNDISGDGQVSTVGGESSKPLVVSVTNKKGDPLAGVPVEFYIVGEPKGNYLGGRRAEFLQPKAISDKWGYAKGILRLGTEPGDYYVSVR